MALNTSILKYLIEHKEASIRQISRDLKIDYKNTYVQIQNLKKKNIISIKPIGKANLITLTSELHPLIFQAEYERKEALNKDLKLVDEYFERNLSTKFYVLLLFGSYAKKTHTKHSDIDLFFITPQDLEKETIEKEINKVAAMIPLKLHLNIFTEKEFISMKNSKLPTVGSEAIKNNIILHGVETYYQLLQ